MDRIIDGSWQFYRAGTEETGWQVQGDVLSYEAGGFAGTALALRKEEPCCFGRVSVEVMFASRSEKTISMGPVAAYGGIMTYYFLSMDDMADGRNLLRLRRMESGVPARLAEAALDL